MSSLFSPRTWFQGTVVIFARQRAIVLSQEAYTAESQKGEDKATQTATRGLYCPRRYILWHTNEQTIVAACPLYVDGSFLRRRSFPSGSVHLPHLRSVWSREPFLLPLSFLLFLRPTSFHPSPNSSSRLLYRPCLSTGLEILLAILCLFFSSQIVLVSFPTRAATSLYTSSARHCSKPLPQTSQHARLRPHLPDLSQDAKVQRRLPLADPPCIQSSLGPLLQPPSS